MNRTGQKQYPKISVSITEPGLIEWISAQAQREHRSKSNFIQSRLIEIRNASAASPEEVVAAVPVGLNDAANSSADDLARQILGQELRAVGYGKRKRKRPTGAGGGPGGGVGPG